MHDIDRMIGDLDIKLMQEKLRLLSNSGGEVTPRDYQWLAYALCGKEIAKYDGPFIVNASVGAGKTIIMAMLAKRFSELGMRGLCLARQAELIKQNSEAMWSCGVDNSTFSAGLKVKSIRYPIIAGTEKSIWNSLMTDMADFAPGFILLDECLTGDSMIECDDGFYRIDDIALNEKKIKCISESSGETFYHKPVRVFTNDIKHVSSIKLTTGEELKCTSTHRLLSDGSWRRAGSLTAGERLTLCGRRDSFMKKLRRAVAGVVRELFL